MNWGIVLPKGVTEQQAATYDVYLYIVKAKEPPTPRDIMRAKNIISTSVVNRHLDKLTKWGWVSEDAYGRYVATRKVSFKGYFWLGRRLLPTSVLSLIAFVAIMSITITALASHLFAGFSLDLFALVLIGITIVAGPVLLAETLRPRKKQPKENPELS
jgi:hypothetical protein